MGLFNALMERRARVDAGMVSDETESFLASKKPVRDKRWVSWTFAEQARLRGDVGRSSRWLEIATRLADQGRKDVVWQAEYASTAGELLLGVGEPAQAFGYLKRSFEAWNTISDTLLRPMAGGGVDRSVGKSVVDFVKALLADEPKEIDPTSPQVMVAWMKERFIPRTVEAGLSLIRVASRVERTETAERSAKHLLDWMPKVIQGLALAVFVGDVHRDLGNYYQDVGRTRDAVEEFNRGLSALKPFARDRLTKGRILQLEFNRANGLARSGQEKEAISVYERLETEFRARREHEPILRTRYARLHLRWRMGEGAALQADLRRLIADYAVLLKSVSRDKPKYHATKVALEMPYRLLLTVIAEDWAEHAGSLHELFGLVSALRDESSVVQEERISDLPAIDMRRVISSPIALLGRRLRRLPDTLLLLVEPGVDCVVFIALKGGIAPLAERLVVAAAGKEFADAAKDLLTEARSASDLLIARAVSAQGFDATPVRNAARKVTQSVPGAVRKAISDAACILYSPSSMGEVDEIPLELILTDGDYLGINCIVSRVPSLRHLLQLLAPNRLNRTLSAQGAILQASDPPDLDLLDDADEDAERILRAARILGLDAKVDKAPDPHNLLRTLDSGIRLIHYIGHGMAGEAGEQLFLGPTARLHASQLSALDGSRTPFVYLSTCLVGRARHLAGGRLKGFGVALLEHGAPGVIAASYAVPDHVCGRISMAFYRGAWKHPVGEAMRQARRRLNAEGVHPVCWGSFSLHGDPYATISEEIEADSLAHRTCDWPALLTRFLATKDESYRSACRALLRDARNQHPEHARLLDAVTKVLDKVSSGVKRMLSLIDDLVPFDVEGAAALRLLLASRRLEALRKKKMNKADQETCRQEIGTALSLALALQDSYSFLIFAVAHDEFLTTTMHEKMAVLKHADRCMRLLEADGTRLRGLGKKIQTKLKALNSATVVDLHSLLGVDPELFRRADEGDEEALREINSRVMAQEAGVKLAVSGGNWTDWMLRYIGTDSKQVLSGLMGAVQRDKRSGASKPRVADLLWKYLSSYRGAGEADPGLYKALQEELPQKSRERRVLNLFRLFDQIVSQPETYSRTTAARGLALAEQIGHEGATAYFRMLVAQVEIREDRLAPAKDLLLKAIEPLHRLAGDDPEYSNRARMAVQNARAVSALTGDMGAVRIIDERFGPGTVKTTS